MTHRLAGKRAPCIGNGGTDRRHAGFADAGRLLRRRDDGDFDARHLADAQHPVVVVVGLHHPAFVQRDLVVEDRAKAEADAAFHLRLDGVGIHGYAAIDRAPYFFDLRQAVLAFRYFRDLGDITVEGLLHGYAARPLRAYLGSLPAGELRYRTQDAGLARFLREKGEPPRDRVLAGGSEQLVYERFLGVRGVRVSHRAPPKDRNADLRCA